MGKNKKYANTVPVFRLKKTGNESGTIKHVGYIDRDEKLLDELLDLTDDDKYNAPNYANKSLFLGSLCKHHITIGFYKCNLAGSYLLDNKTLPVYYFNVYYKNNIVTGSLMEYYYYFTMDEESKKRLTSAPKYVNAQVTGKYHFGLRANVKLGEQYRELVRKRLIQKRKEKLTEERKKALQEKINQRVKEQMEKAKSGENGEKVEKNEEDEEIEEVTDEDIDPVTEEELDEYKKFFDTPIHVCKSRSLRYVVQEFMKICNDEKFRDIIYVALQMRVLERREEAGIDSDEEFEVPEDAVNVHDDKALKEKYEETLLDF